MGFQAEPERVIDLALQSVQFDLYNDLADDDERGSVLPLAHYLARYKGHEELVAKEYLRFRETDAARGSPVGGTLAGETFGPYRLVRLLGRGGQGAVHLAEDTRIGRLVALKVLPPEWVTETRVERLRREALALSRLEHPDICAIYEADTATRSPYIAMRYVEGHSLAAQLEASSEDRPLVGALPLPPRTRPELACVLRAFERIARALHAAHEEGILHRDVKPGNVIFTTEGDPVLLDFGLARAERGDGAALTVAGEVHGTPAYMAPEQRRGEPVDRRADVYALGVVLYECLTLARPFGTLAQPSAADVATPARRANPAVPADLDVVLSTCLEHDAARRYPTALELAEELRRVVGYEPIRARPAGPARRALRWAQRHPSLAGALGGVFAVLLAGLFLALVLLARETDARRRAEGLYWGAVASSVTREDPALGLAASHRASQLAPSAFSRSATLEALWRLPGRRELGGHAEPVVSCATAGELLASGDTSGELRLWEPRSGEHLVTIATGSSVQVLAVDPSEPRVVSGHADGSVRIYAVDGSLVARAEAHGDAVGSLAFSLEGRWLVSGSADGTACLFDRSLRERHRLGGHGAPVRECTFDPTGRHLLTLPYAERVPGCDDYSMRLWSVETGELLALAEHDGPVSEVAFDAEGGRALSASLDGTARVWSVPLLEPLARLDHDGNSVRTACFAPGGRHVVTGFHPEPLGSTALATGLAIWDAETGELRRELPGHRHRPVYSIGFSPDGSRMYSASWDRTIRVWDTDLWREEVSLADREGLQLVRWGSGSDFLAYTTWAGTKLWYPEEPAELRALVGHLAPVTWASFTGDDRKVVTASRDGTARVWDAASGRELARLSCGGEALTAAELVEDRLYVGTELGRTVLWTLQGEELGRWADHRGEVRGVAIDPSGGTWISVAACGRISARGEGGESRWEADEGDPITAVAVGGGRVAAGTEGRAVVVRDLETGERLWQWAFEATPRGSKVLDVAFSPDGGGVAVAADDLGWRILDAATGEELRRGPASTVGDLEFSPDGRALALALKWRDGLHVIHLDGGGPALAYRGHGEKLASVRFHPTRPLVLTASFDHTARLWRTDRSELFCRFPAHEGPVVVAEFSHDGSRVLTGSADGAVRIFPVDPVGAAEVGFQRDIEASVRGVGLALPEPR